MLNIFPCAYQQIFWEKYLFKSFAYYFEKFIYLLFSVLGLPCCMGFSLVVASRGSSLVAACRRLTAVASLIVEHGL